VVKAQGVSNLPAAAFGNSDRLQQGDTVLAMGSPLGLDGSVTAGIVSALHRTFTAGAQGADGETIPDAIQTDAAINPGNSGGPLVNLAGEVIGINTAIATSGQSEGNIGVGFAIPSNRAKEVSTALLKGEKVSHPYLGIGVADATGGGAVVSDVVSDSPAANAGLARGDVITKVGTKAIRSADDLIAAVQAAKPGEKLSVTINRNGSEKQVSVTVGERQ
jgi:putative serine protease PepD